MFQIINIVSYQRSRRRRGADNEGREQINGLCTLSLEWPLPGVDKLNLHRSLVFRAVIYLWCAVLASELRTSPTPSSRSPSPAPVFLYQTIDVGVFYFITSSVFFRAAM